MDENLIGYLLDALDEPTRQQVETYLQQHPEARDRLVLLKQALAPLAADQEAPAPMPQLAERTLAKIAEHICSAPETTAKLPKAPAVSSGTLAGGRIWWRRADVLVAACLLLMIGGIGLTVLGRLRGPNSAALMIECKNNLRQFYLALQEYRDKNGSFPDINSEAPRNVAGIVVPILIDKGMLSATASIRCPGNGPPMSCQLTMTALRALSDDEFAQRSPCLSMCYAYSLGWRDDEGGLHAPAAGPDIALSQTPIMADRPPPEGIISNSLNHGREGQNVLFSDGHVHFMRERTFGKDDIFLNGNREVAAGINASDIVLGYSAAKQ